MCLLCPCGRIIAYKSSKENSSCWSIINKKKTTNPLSLFLYSIRVRRTKEFLVILTYENLLALDRLVSNYYHVDVDFKRRRRRRLYAEQWSNSKETANLLRWYDKKEKKSARKTLRCTSNDMIYAWIIIVLIINDIVINDQNWNWKKNERKREKKRDWSLIPWLLLV